MKPFVNMRIATFFIMEVINADCSAKRKRSNDQNRRCNFIYHLMMKIVESCRLKQYNIEIEFGFNTKNQQSGNLFTHRNDNENSAEAESYPYSTT